jgi:hypothetical protein
MQARWLGFVAAGLPLLVIGAAAQAVPGQSGVTGWVNMRQPDCVARAEAAIRSIGYQVRHVDSWYVHGFGDGLFVSVFCIADDGSTNLVNPNAGRLLRQILVVRQTPGPGDPYNARHAIYLFMEGNTAAPPAPAQPPPPTPAVRGRYLSVAKSVFASSEAVVVYWANAPFRRQGEWVNVVLASEPADRRSSKPTKWGNVANHGGTNGQMSAGQLPPGVYEARFYLTGNYQRLDDRITFTVR